jgi:hypothetical protein
MDSRDYDPIKHPGLVILRLGYNLYASEGFDDFLESFDRVSAVAPPIAPAPMTVMGSPRTSTGMMSHCRVRC